MRSPLRVACWPAGDGCVPAPAKRSVRRAARISAARGRSLGKLGQAAPHCALLRSRGPPRLTGGVRVPTSVLLAVLAAAGLLALAPALVRRYDATERLAAERASSTARVLQRRRRRRTVPGRRPINPGRLVSVTVSPASSPQRPRLRLVKPGRRPARRIPTRRH